MYIAEIPPIRIPERADLGAKVSLFNGRIRSTKIDNVAIIQTTPYYKEVKYELTMDGDGFHLANDGQDALKDALEDAATNKQPKQDINTSQPKDTAVTLHVNTVPDHIGVVLGKKGATKNRIEAQTGARIRVINSTLDSTIQIKGTEENAQKAKSAIEKILSDKAKSATTVTDDKAKSATAQKTKEQDNSTKVCHFFKQGKCLFGASCNNSHTRDNNKRPRSPSPNRTRKNQKHAPNTHSRNRDPRPRNTPRQQERPNFTILE